MKRLLPITSFLLSITALNAQNNTLFLKQGNRTIYSYWRGLTISFQTKDLNWQKGEIVKLQSDSVYIRPMIVRYFMMGTDTSYLPIEGFALTDIHAFPKRGVLIDFIDGRFQISRSGGHVNWYWVKSGLIFRIGAIAYASLHTVNGLIDHDFSFKESKNTFATTAALWGFGFMLKKIYKPILPVGRKYTIAIVQL